MPNAGQFSYSPQRWLANPVSMFVGRVLILVLFLVAWQAASGRFLSPLWFSSPLRVYNSLLQMIVDGSLWYHMRATILTLVLGYALGAFVGLIFGFLLGLAPRIEAILSPVIAALWSLPKVALLPLIVLFLGIGLESKIVLVSTVVVFLVLFSAIDGIRDVNSDLIDALRLMGANRREILIKVQIPSALPWVYSGLRVAVSYALTTTVAGELLSSNRGLGFIMESAAATFDTSKVFAAVIVVVTMSILITNGISRLEQYSSRWRA